MLALWWARIEVYATDGEGRTGSNFSDTGERNHPTPNTFRLQREITMEHEHVEVSRKHRNGTALQREVGVIFRVNVAENKGVANGGKGRNPPQAKKL